MELYKFFWGALAWIATVACLWPVNVPVLALAYKIQQGTKPIDEDMRDELWYRATLGAFFLALATAGFIFLDYLFLDYTEFPAGPIHLVVFMAYVPAGAFILFYFLGYSDLLDGLGLFVIYIGLPLALLVVVNAVLGVWNPLLNFVYGYLKAPT